MDAAKPADATRGQEARPLSVGSQIEKLIVLNATNRFIWLVFILTGLLLLQLSLLQRNTTRFDTMELVAILMAVLEVAAVLILMLLLGGTPQTQAAWRKRHPATPFSYIANAIAAMLLCVVLIYILLVPLMIAHQYPDLIEKGIHIPLTMIQRVSLFLGAVLIAGNLACILRFYARLPWRLAALLGLVCHVVIGYLVILGSTQFEAMRRLNDVFYYNQLWHYTDLVPNLQNPQVFHNIEQTYTSLYIFVAATAWLVTFLLWVPKASLDAAREARQAK